MNRRILGLCGAAAFTVAVAMPGQTAQSAQPGEASLVDDLVIANRVLASDELDVLDVYGHASTRSRRNPERFYIARNVPPAFVTARDVIENDLNGDAVPVRRLDQYEERFIDTAIYRARPDVTAIVHSHAPELIAFSISSVALPAAGGRTPVYDVRKFNNGRLSEITTPELGRSLAEALGRGNAVLLLGHGAVVVGTSVRGAVSAANGLVRGARLQMQMMAMRGTIVPNPRGIAPNANQGAAPPPAPSKDEDVLDTVNNGVDRAWDHWRRLGARLLRENTIETVRRSSDALEALKRDLVIASRILSGPEVGILDTAGHVTVRHPGNPNRFFITRAMAPGSATVESLIENDLDSQAVTGPRSDQFLEVHIHGQIYKARPDVMAVIHSHTPELVAFGQTSVRLRPVSIGGAFIGDGLPLWVVGKYDPMQSLVATPALGRSLAEVMGRKPGALLTGHGIAFTDSSLYGLVKRVYDLRLNAIIQQQAIMLGGDITYLEGQDGQAGADGRVQPDGSGGGAGVARFWEYWSRQVSLER
jgi:ribulose-5-phosphate 4-epimerase/fuculose-1-phosphate aldolase